MEHFSAHDAKNNFERLLDAARREPVFIKKKGRSVAVILYMEEYQRFEHLEEELWALRAKSAEEEGFLGTEASQKLLKDLLDAEAYSF